MSKLGDKLKKTLAEMESARIEGLEKQNTTDLNAVRQEREAFDLWLDEVTLNIVTDIEEERVPLYKVEDFERMEWVKAAHTTGKARHQDIWTEFKQYFVKEGLEIRVVEANDGSTKSWLNITVLPLPPRPRLGGVTRKDSISGS